MTMPGQNAPDGAWTLGSRYGQGITEADVRKLLRGNVLGGYQDAQTGIKQVNDGITNRLNDFRDSQLDFNNRLDLLEGVSGYCSLFLSANWQLAGGAYRRLPFDSQLGPRKGTELAQNGIRLLSKGLWRADAHLTWRPAPSGWGQSNTAGQTKIVVLYADSGAVYTEKEFDGVITPYGPETCAFSHTFVIPEDQKFVVQCHAAHPKDWHWIDGGTVKSALSVNKWDSRTDNNVQAPTVPDGGVLS
ncbi:hypothetical protein D5S18_02950 [Nocardia panacis]|uniref:Uncharacterized protein n=1 Tax=Nocardia panacis TaxID=2340916 RepID=A0A3A4KT34_9NOCA|nr:hypothetical protein [Nocardia panacis]RJO79305.1 hypothetical protein D5S18_02950 [Nocardia panacis]